MIFGSEFLLAQCLLPSLSIKQAIMKKLHKKQQGKKKTIAKITCFIILYSITFYYKDSQ